MISLTDKIKLRYLYLKTRLHQKIHRDGSFPYKGYAKLTEYVAKYKVEQALECGTAVGLTAAAIVLGNEKVKLDTIEKWRRNLSKAENNIKKYFPANHSQISFIEGKYFDVLETEEYKDKKYDLIFLDAYVSRYNEVYFLSKYLKDGGIFIVSNLREEIPKSVLAKEFLLDNNNFELLEIIDDTVFCKKRQCVL